MVLSVVILTWNSIKHISDCFISLLSELSDIEHEIIVIDNGSTDGSVELIEKICPYANIIKNTKNLGVAPARNQGIRVSKGEFILILDIDTQLQKDSIKTLIAYMKENIGVGLCAPRLNYSNGDVQLSCRRFPLIHTKLLRRINTEWAQEILKREYYDSILLSGSKPLTVDYAIGACQCIRKKAIEEIGVLDEKIFYGPEDVDFCLRLWLKGWSVVFVPLAQVIHLEQRITKKFFSKITFKHVQGLFYFFLKHRYAFSRKRLYSKIASKVENTKRY